jgi:5-amino-6-(5-phospho-D-ribitylamino)uracil phosphatase
VIEFVVTDLDGTLWEGDGLVPSSTRLAIEELRRRQIPLLAATSRRSHTVANYFERLELDLPALLLNGALGRREGRREVFHHRSFTTDGATGVLQVFERHGVHPCVHFETQLWDIVSGPTPSAGRPYLESNRAQLRMVDDLDAMCASLPVYQFSVCAADEVGPLQRVRNDLEASDALAEVVLSPDARIGGWTLDVSPFGVTKWSGVEAFAAVYGLDVTKALAIGDGDNDVELLDRAAESFAMSHASERALAAAKIVLPGGMDGWGRLLDYL